MNGRICLECKHCYVDGGSPGYSEYTPGEGITFECTKGHDIGTKSIYDLSRKGLLVGIQRAHRCGDFEEEQP